MSRDTTPATQHDLDLLGGQLGMQMQELRDDVTGQMQGFREEIKDEMDEFKQEMKGEMNELREDVDKKLKFFAKEITDHIDAVFEIRRDEPVGASAAEITFMQGK